MLQDWKRGRNILSVLNGLACKRVALIAQPENCWVVERGLPRDDDDTEAALVTARMRRWAAINRAHPWTLVNTLLALGSTLAAFVLTSRGV